MPSTPIDTVPSTPINTTPNAIHAYIDLGLPSGTLWATCNVGATKPEEYGDYFAWGETEAEAAYTSSNSKWHGVAYSDLKSQGVIDAQGNLTAKYDAATANWDSSWRMPTLDEIKELLTIKNEYEKLNGVEGRVFIGKNGNTLFLPFAGDRLDGVPRYAGEQGNYWSATAREDNWGAYSLSVISEYAAWCYGNYRFEGMSVRPVRTK